ncbi:MAG: TetR/AcrR family transcriptional regulator [Novosphingobium sp.]
MNAPTPRRPGRPSLSNEQLLDHACDLFLEQGFERTSIEAICARAGMAKRTVYARYGDKTTLFRAALQRAIAEWIVPIERLRAAEAEDLEASLLAIGNILLANIMSPAGLRLLRLTNSESSRSPDIGAYNVEQGTEPTIAYLADLFIRRLPGQLAPLEARAAAEGFLHLVTGPAIDAAWGVRREDAALARHIASSVGLFLHGLQDAEASGGDGAALEAENRRLRAKLARIEAVLGEG